MYSIEDRMKAIKLYKAYGCCARAVIRELGYPSRNRLAMWYKEYQARGSMGSYESHKHLKYSHEQRQKAIDFYQTNGRSIHRTVKALGYPGKTTLCDWLNEEVPNDQRKWSCKAYKPLIRCTREQKEQAIKTYCVGEHTPTELGKIYGVDPYTIYRWKDKLLGQENKTVMPKKSAKCSMILSQRPDFSFCPGLSD